MKRKIRRRKGAEFVDADFAEILYGEDGSSPAANRQAQRKNQQFCRQVQRALNLALADAVWLSSECELFVDDVSPAPDSGHLMVHIVVQAGHSIADAMEALRRHQSCLRSEVAMAIARKRAPEFMFVPISAQGDNNE